MRSSCTQQPDLSVHIRQDQYPDEEVPYRQYDPSTCCRYISEELLARSHAYAPVPGTLIPLPRKPWLRALSAYVSALSD